MFCEQCGETLGINGNFCGVCGAPRQSDDQSTTTKPSKHGIAADSFQQQLENKAAQYATEAGFDSVPSEYLDISRTLEFEEWVKQFQDKTLPIGFQLEGFVNAEVGAVWFSTQPKYSCDACHWKVTYEFLQIDCADCGRTTSNFCSSPIGKGDGTYPVYQGQTASGSGFLAVLATEAGEDGQGAINDLLGQVLVRNFAAVESREDLVKLPVSFLLTLPEYVVTKVGALVVESQDFTNGQFHFPGLAQVLISGPRTTNHLDCSEVRIGWEPGEFEVLAITRGSATEEVNVALNSVGEDNHYFDRPEILAVFVVRASEVQNLFPSYKKIKRAQDVRLFERTDRWIELARPLHGDLFAIWANWELLNHYLGEIGEADSTLADIYKGMVMEGYLHQIWTLMQTNPATFQQQISELGGLRSGFQEIVGYCTQPGAGLTRSDLRDWFLQGSVPRS